MNTLSLPLHRLLGHTADALLAVREGRSLSAVLPKVPESARPGTQALVFHVMRWLGSADAARRHLAPKAPPPAVDALLTSALALLWPASEAPAYAPHTLVDQAVKAATQRKPGSAPFVNAVLRRFLRERDSLVELLCRSDAVARHNHPAWWIERLCGDWPEQYEALLQANNAHPPFTLRANVRRTSGAAYAQQLHEAGLDVRSVAGSCITLAHAVPVSRLPGFDDGDVSVQDASAQLAAPLLVGEGLRPGARVLDACAAPGGKTAHLLELADLDVLALDADAERLRRVDDTLTRLKLTARTQAANAARPADWWDGRLFDAILLDAPCTASGVVRRHPDARWLRRASDVAALAATQARLLDALWPLLAPGGRLVYCTCSVFKEEGAAQVQSFLARTPEARLDADHSPGHVLPLADNAGNESRGGDTQQAGPPHHAAAASFHPGASEGDGFFHALLLKPAER